MPPDLNRQPPHNVGVLISIELRTPLARRDSNPRPARLVRAALPTELRGAYEGRGNRARALALIAAHAARTRGAVLGIAGNLARARERAQIRHSIHRLPRVRHIRSLGERPRRNRIEAAMLKLGDGEFGHARNHVGVRSRAVLVLADLDLAADVAQ